MGRITFISILLLCVTGCATINGEEGYFRDRSRDYYGSHLIAPLELPAGVDFKQSSDKFPVPHNIPENLEVVSMEPPGFDR